MKKVKKVFVHRSNAREGISRSKSRFRQEEERKGMSSERYAWGLNVKWKENGKAGDGSGTQRRG